MIVNSLFLVLALAFYIMPVPVLVVGVLARRDGWDAVLRAVFMVTFYCVLCVAGGLSGWELTLSDRISELCAMGAFYCLPDIVWGLIALVAIPCRKVEGKVGGWALSHLSRGKRHLLMPVRALVYVACNVAVASILWNMYPLGVILRVSLYSIALMLLPELKRLLFRRHPIRSSELREQSPE